MLQPIFYVFMYIFSKLEKNNCKQRERKGIMKKYILSFISIAVIFVMQLTFVSFKTENHAQAASSYKNDLQLLARCVNGEARGEPYTGQVAVAAVILNRVKHPSFPNTIAGVIYQKGAFTATVDGQINVPISSGSSVYKACRDAMNGWDPTGGAIYYYNPQKTTNKWIYSREVVKIIGKHRFAK